MDNEEIQGVKFSEFPSQTPVNADEVVGLHSGDNARFSIANIVAAVRNGLANIFVPKTDVGVADGVASLDSNGKVPGTQLDLSGKQSTITASGILKGDGQGGVSAAVSGTDYQAPLTAGTDYATPAMIPSVPSASTSNPAMDGTASPGSSGAWAKGDHVHPSDTTKANQAQLAYVETGTTASRTYAVGEYFCWNGLLYRVTSAISSGASFTPGTNCEQVTGGGFNDILSAPIFTGNCNDLPAGFAYAYSSATNIPAAGGSYFIITMRYSNHGAQIAIRRDGNAAYYRRCSSGSWASTWVAM